METLSCHSNESTWATIIKSIMYVEANVMNIYVKVSASSPLRLLRIFFFENLAFQLPWQPIEISDLDKIHKVGRGLL